MTVGNDQAPDSDDASHGNSGNVGFLGTHSHGIDEKYRVTIPAKFKPVLQEIHDREHGPGSNKPLALVVTISLDSNKNLVVYPIPAWNAYIQEFRARSSFDLDAQELYTLITGLANVVELDSQGRIRLNRTLLDFARIDVSEGKRIVITGRVDRFIIWSEKEHGEFVGRALTNLSEKARAVLAANPRAKTDSAGRQ